MDGSHSPTQADRTRDTVRGDLARALRGVDPAVARAGLAAFDRLFPVGAPVGGSALTSDGCPWEMCFHSARDSVIWTADPGMGLGWADQWEQVLTLAGDLGAPISHGALDRIARMQAPGRLGTWISGRHGPGGALRCKLYTDWVDTPRARALTPGLWLPDDLPGAARARLRGLGIGPEPDRLELYFTLPSAGLSTLRAVLRHAGLADLAKAATERLQGLIARDAETALNRTGMVVSLSRDPGGVVASFYGFPGAFWGTDAAARTGFLAELTAQGQATGPYDVATAPLARAAGPARYHGLTMLSVSHAGLSTAIGLRPPPIDPNFPSH